MPWSVPFLSDAQLDSAARELLGMYAKWQGAPAKPPIDVDNIVEGVLGLDFGITDLKQLLGIDDVLGATWFDHKRVRIDASLEGVEGRFAFTVAHELGHWQLHRPHYLLDKSGLGLFTSTPGGSAVPAVVCRNSKKDRAEHQADGFASRLLMPRGAILDTVKELCGPRPPAWSGLKKHLDARTVDPRLRTFASSVIDQGNFSNVSNEAMRIRLVQLGVVRDADEIPPQLF